MPGRCGLSQETILEWQRINPAVLNGGICNATYTNADGNIVNCACPLADHYSRESNEIASNVSTRYLNNLKRVLPFVFALFYIGDGIAKLLNEINFTGVASTSTVIFVYLAVDIEFVNSKYYWIYYLSFWFLECFVGDGIWAAAALKVTDSIYLYLIYKMKYDNVNGIIKLNFKNMLLVLAGVELIFALLIPIGWHNGCTSVFAFFILMEVFAEYHKKLFVNEREHRILFIYIFFSILSAVFEWFEISNTNEVILYIYLMLELLTASILYYILIYCNFKNDDDYHLMDRNDIVPLIQIVTRA